MNRDEIRQALRNVPREQCVAFAARAALRVLPLLLGVNSKQTKGIPFDYWPEKARAKYLLALLRANAAAVFRSVGGHVSVEVSHEARTAVAVAAAAAAAYDAAYATYAAATAATTAADAADAAYVAAYVAADAAAAFLAHNGGKTIPNITKDIEADLALLKRKNTPNSDNLLHLPLWQASPKDDLAAWQSLLQEFNAALLSLDPSFEIWLPWYAARVRGDAIRPDESRIWVDYPPEIAAQGPAAVNGYISSRLREDLTQPLNRVRTIFIGYGEAGKTSLIRALHGEDVVQGEEVMTPGIEIREWPHAGNGLITHFWDFGGQVVAHATHQFFLRSSCLYVLVLSARAEINANEQAEYWLQHVKAYGENAPVMLVGNKCDQASLHLDMANLKQKYPNIVNFYPVACTEAKAGEHKAKFEYFRAEFCAQLAQVGTRQVMFSPAQFAVLQEIRTLSARNSFLPRKDFEALCERHRVTDQGVLNRAWLLDILDKLGVIIHFPKMLLTDDYVLNPRWLTYGVYTVMYARQAYVDEASVYALLSKDKIRDEQQQELCYEPSKCRVIVDAMQRFKLCYPKPGTVGEMIIPSLLPTEMPSTLPNVGSFKSEALAYKMKFDSFLPRHIMPQLIVEQHHYIIADAVWQYGVGLDNPTLQARAMVQVDYQARELSIWTLGTGCRDYLALLRCSLQEMLRILTLQYTELIRLPASALMNEQRTLDKEDWADFAQVEHFRRLGERKFISPQGAVYDLFLLAGMVFPQNGSSPTQIHVAGNAHFSQGDFMSKQSINITGSTVNGAITVADKMEHVNINNQSANAATPEAQQLQQTLQQLLQEIQALNAKVPAAQKEVVDYAAENVQELIAESQKDKPLARKLKDKLNAITSGLEEVGGLVPAVGGLLAQASKLLGISE